VEGSLFPAGASNCVSLGCGCWGQEDLLVENPGGKKERGTWDEKKMEKPLLDRQDQNNKISKKSKLSPPEKKRTEGWGGRANSKGGFYTEKTRKGGFLSCISSTEAKQQPWEGRGWVWKSGGGSNPTGDYHATENHVCQREGGAPLYCVVSDSQTVFQTSQTKKKGGKERKKRESKMEPGRDTEKELSREPKTKVSPGEAPLHHCEEKKKTKSRQGRGIKEGTLLKRGQAHVGELANYTIHAVGPTGRWKNRWGGVGGGGQ